MTRFSDASMNGLELGGMIKGHNAYAQCEQKQKWRLDSLNFLTC